MASEDVSPSNFADQLDVKRNIIQELVGRDSPAFHHPQRAIQTETNPEIVMVIATKAEYDYISGRLLKGAKNIPLDKFEFGDTEHTEINASLSVQAARVSRTVEMQIIVLGRAGEVRAAAVTMSVLSRMEKRPKIVVNLGISATMNKDVAPADVVIATEIARYLENHKVVDSDTDAGGRTFQFQIRTESYLPCPDVALLRQLDIGPALADFKRRYTKFSRNIEKRMLQSSHASSKGADRHIPHYGRITSGPLLVNSKAFKKIIQDADANVLCLDMESYGFSFGVNCLPEKSRPPRWCVIRGISDLGDGTKGDSDAAKTTPYRQVAMIKAFEMFRILLATYWSDVLMRSDK